MERLPYMRKLILVLATIAALGLVAPSAIADVRTYGPIDNVNCPPPVYSQDGVPSC